MGSLRRCSVLLVLVLLCSVLAGGLPAAAGSTASSAPSVAASGMATSATAPGYVEGCPTRPAPGTYTCYSLHQTGFHPLLATPEGYGPADLRSAYALPDPTSAAGSGQTVYVIDAFGYPDAESDLAVYRNQYGLPPCTTANGCFRKLDQNGGKNYPTDYVEGWAGETALDLDMVSAVCPKCKITLIQADTNGNDLFTAVDRANQLGARYISMSWGGQEDGTEAHYDSLYFNRPGVVYAASSGDGAYDVGVSYPSTAKNAVAVGGTTLVRSSTARGWSETVWNDPARGFGTGSGCSDYLAKPVWQNIIASSVCTRRAGNDVAAVADPNTGVAVYQKESSYGAWSVSGGTSASAPMIAAMYALAGPPAAGDAPASYPYAQAGALNDVVGGENGSCTQRLLCTAAAGWDGPTGMGTPRGVSAFHPPAQVISQANPGDQHSVVGTAVNLALSATDVPGRVVTWSAAGLPPGLAITTGVTSGTTTAGRIAGTPTANGVYPVTITAKDSTGAAVSVHLSWTVGRPGTYVPLAGARLLDTRSGVGAPAGQLYGGEAASVQIAGRGGVPVTGVSAVVLTVTATNPAASGWVSVGPGGAAPPTTSNLNFDRGQTVAGLVTTRLGISGDADVYSSVQGDVIADVVGYYLAGAAADPGAFVPLYPSRLLDTRGAIGAPTARIPAGGAVSLQVAGRGGVPNGAGAVILNVTAVAPAGTGWVTVHPDLVARPTASNLNYTLHRTVPNLVVVPVSSNGKVRLSVSGAATDLVADVFGYYRAGVPTTAGAFGALTSARILDTRTGRGLAGGPTTLAAGSTTRIKVTGQGGVPTGKVSAVVLNVTAVGSPGPGWAALYQDGTPRPATSNLNWTRNQTVANLVVVPVSAAGDIQVSVNGSGTGLIADVAGYFAAGG